MDRNAKRKKLTFVVIPHANGAIKRFGVRKFWLYFIPTMLTLSLTVLSLTAYVQYQLHEQSLLVSAGLKAELEKTRQSLRQTVQAKDREIDRLQNDVITLSQEAEEVRDKVEALRQLESEIKGMTGQPGEAASGRTEGSMANQETGKVAAGTDVQAAGNARRPVTVASVRQDIGLYTQDQSPKGNQVTSQSLHWLFWPDAGEEAGAAGNFQGIGGLQSEVSNKEIRQLAVRTLEDYSALAEEMNRLYADLEQSKQQYLAYMHRLRITPSIWPTDSRKVTSTFGYRRDPFTWKPSLHTGIDIGAGYGAPIYATADGTVTDAGYDRYQGNAVTINHTQGVRTRYMHMSKILVKAGDKVSKGEIIGKVGSTGRSTGPHLHYEVIKNGKLVDPKPYMNSTRKDGR